MLIISSSSGGPKSNIKSASLRATVISCELAALDSTKRGRPPTLFAIENRTSGFQTVETGLKVTRGDLVCERGGK